MLYHAQNVPVAHSVRIAPSTQYIHLPTLPMVYEGDGLYFLRGKTSQETRKASSNLFDINATWDSNGGIFLIDSNARKAIPIKPFQVVEGENYVVITKGEAVDNDYSALYFGGDDLYYNNPSGNDTMILKPYAPGAKAFDANKEKKKLVTATKSCIITRIMIHGSNISAAGAYSVEYIGIFAASNTDISYEPYYPAKPSLDPGGESPLISTYKAGDYLIDLSGIKWLLTLDDDLRSAGDAADVLYVDTYNRTAWVDKNVQSLRLDGTLNYMHEMDYTACAWYTLVCAAYGIAVNPQSWGQDIICDKLATSQPDTANPNREYIIINGWSKTVMISIQKNRMDGYDDGLTYAQKVQAVKSYFQSNSFEVYCQLATSKKCPLDFVELDLKEDTSIIEVKKTVNARIEYFLLEGTSWQEVTEASKNLFDKTAVKTGCYVDATGAEIASTPWNIAIIPLQPGKSIAITVGYQGAAPKYCFYNPSGELLLSTQDTVVPVPNGTSYAKISVHTNDLDTFMLEYGEKQTDYEPYRPASPSAESPSPILSLEDFDVVVHGKNLLDWHGAIDYTRWHTTSLDDDHPYGYYPYLIVDGFVPGETYTIAADSIPELGAADLYCHLGTYPGGNKGQANWMYHKTASALCKSARTFVATESVYYLNCSGCKADTVSRVVFDWLPNLRIYQGSYTADTIPPYTPYYRQNVHIPFALRAVGDGKDQLAVDQKAKKVTVTRHVDPEKIDPTKSIYDNPDQYLLDQPVVEDITDTATGQALPQLAMCYPNSIIEIECDNGLTGQMTTQVLILGR